MERVYNFSPGPSMLAEPVLEQAQKDMMCYGTSGMSVMEMSHRSKMYIDIYDRAVADLRELMAIPDDYEVLFLQGGATQQFSAVPLNLMVKGKADYVDSGNFAHLAAEEGKRYGEIHVVASSREDTYTYVPDLTNAPFDPDADYVHITSNNTIYGTRYVELPQVIPPLVTDASSMILSEVMDVKRFGVIYAGAQKNIGPSGLCVVIVPKGFAGPCHAHLPQAAELGSAGQGRQHVQYAQYLGHLCGRLTFQWLKAQGGVAAMEQRNIEKAALLYDFLDNSRLFKPTAQKKYRSRMNVTFVTGDPDKDAAFVKAATQAGLVNLKGPPYRGWHARQHLQCHAQGRCGKAGGFMKQFEMENA